MIAKASLSVFFIFVIFASSVNCLALRWKCRWSFRAPLQKLFHSECSKQHANFTDFKEALDNCLPRKDTEDIPTIWTRKQLISYFSMLSGSLKSYGTPSFAEGLKVLVGRFGCHRWDAFFNSTPAPRLPIVFTSAIKEVCPNHTSTIGFGTTNWSRIKKRLAKMAKEEANGRLRATTSSSAAKADEKSESSSSEAEEGSESDSSGPDEILFGEDNSPFFFNWKDINMSVKPKTARSKTARSKTINEAFDGPLDSKEKQIASGVTHTPEGQSIAGLDLAKERLENYD